MAGLKRALSDDVLGFFEDIGKSENKTVDDELNEMLNEPMAPTDQVRNETINGDRATIEYLDEKGKWRPMDFVKVGNEWKMTLPKADPSESKETNKK